MSGGCYCWIVSLTERSYRTHCTAMSLTEYRMCYNTYKPNTIL